MLYRRIFLYVFMKINKKKKNYYLKADNNTIYKKEPIECVVLLNKLKNKNNFSRHCETK